MFHTHIPLRTYSTAGRQNSIQPLLRCPFLLITVFAFPNRPENSKCPENTRVYIPGKKTALTAVTSFIHLPQHLATCQRQRCLKASFYLTPVYLTPGIVKIIIPVPLIVAP